MTAKVKAARTATPLAPFPGAAVDLGPNPLAPPETRRQMLKALGERLDGHIRFMCEVERMPGLSAESKDRAVGAFHQRLASMEGELGRIRENLQLE
jgi:hypothetical protein